jgi:transposase-like protein
MRTKGLKAAAAKVLAATWQRCKVHFLRNALAHAGKGQRCQQATRFPQFQAAKIPHPVS